MCLTVMRIWPNKYFANARGQISFDLLLSRFPSEPKAANTTVIKRPFSSYLFVDHRRSWGGSEVSAIKAFLLFTPVRLDGFQFERVNSLEVLSAAIRDHFKWNDHISTITIKAAKRLYLARQMKRAAVSSSDFVMFYCSVIKSVLEYPCQLFHSRFPTNL